MADHRDPTIATGAPIDRPAVDPRPRPAAGGMTRWIWIAAVAVVALFILMMAFGGGGGETTTAPTDAAPVVIEPAAPAVDPLTAPAAPAD